MCVRHLRALALVSFFLPCSSFAVPITYDFQAVGNYSYSNGTAPTLPADWLSTSAWNVSGTIVVDADIPANYDDPYIRLEQIIGGSLSINGVSLGSFNSGSFSYYFMDGFEESDEPYDANFALRFDGTAEVEPGYLWFYTEDLGYSGPDVSDLDLSSIDAFLDRLSKDDYMEFGVTFGGGGNTWNLDMNLLTDFVPRDSTTPPAEVPEPTSFGLIALGLAGIWWRQSRRVTRVALSHQPSRP
ncbi:MAG TPA: PEP-CTERM sorting domain-containing protein [Dongiaceae bacterium]|nr:PEP-CTERM sorting domain-containing protein [Dongiaceae bacterium]